MSYPFFASLDCVIGTRKTLSQCTTSTLLSSSRRSAAFLLLSDNADVGLDISAHVGKVRALFERMDHTFNMARARSDLRATITRLRQHSDTISEEAGREQNTDQSIDAGEMKIRRKEASSPFKGERHRSCLEALRITKAPFF